jgi:hypothetical protein
VFGVRTREHREDGGLENQADELAVDPLHHETSVADKEADELRCAGSLRFRVEEA